MLDTTIWVSCWILTILLLTNYLIGNHLIGKLLKPFMKGTIFANFYARHTLISQYDSQIDDMFSVGRSGAMKLLSEKMNFRNLVFPKVMTERGFPEDESDGVRNFFYRTDGYKLWHIMSHYVRSIVYRSYLSDSAVILDTQLQQFASSLASKDLGNIPGFPYFILSRAALAETLTTILFSASVVHHVSSFSILRY